MLSNDMTKMKNLMRNVKAFDEKIFDQLFDFDFDTGKTILLSFVEEYQRLKKEMDDLYQKDDLDQLRKTAHELKGASSYVAASSLVWLSEALMANIQKKDKRLLEPIIGLISYEYNLWENSSKAYLMKHAT